MTLTAVAYGTYSVNKKLFVIRLEGTNTGCVCCTAIYLIKKQMRNSNRI